MQKGFNPKRIEKDGIATVNVGRPYGSGPVYQFRIDQEYKHPLLSLENVTYFMEFPNFDYSEDDYLMKQALQENKKICVTIDTWKPDEVKKNFAKFDYNIMVLENKYHKDPNNHQVIITKKGCLNDYYNVDEIVDVYNNIYNIELNHKIIAEARSVELIDLMTGKYKKDNVAFHHKIIFDRSDEVFARYKGTGMMLDGLLLGYPIESTVSLINQFWER